LRRSQFHGIVADEFHTPAILQLHGISVYHVSDSNRFCIAVGHLNDYNYRDTERRCKQDRRHGPRRCGLLHVEVQLPAKKNRPVYMTAFCSALCRI
jgi:NADH pyrophosphatase NudC (nudix superfamily)